MSSSPSYDDSDSYPSSPSDQSDYLSTSPPSMQHADNHKEMIKSFQMKFTYLKEPRKRTRTTPEQLATLTTFFEKQPCPSVKQRKQLADKTAMTPRAIQVWFQNKRAKLRIPGTAAPQQQQQVAKKADLSAPATAPAEVSPVPVSVPAPSVAVAQQQNFTPYVPFQSFLMTQPFGFEDPHFIAPSPTSPFSEDSFDTYDSEEVKSEEFEFFDFVLPQTDLLHGRTFSVY